MSKSDEISTSLDREYKKEISKKTYQKPVIKTEIVQFEKVGSCLKQGAGGGNPCTSPRRS